MQKNIFKKGLSVSVIASMTLILAACGGTTKTEESPSVAPAASNGASPAATAVTGAPVTLKFFSNLPDRKSGMGFAEQTVIDNYIKLNPNVKIEVEALADETFKQKIKAYSSNNEPVDVMMLHGASDLKSLAKAGYVQELNPADYSTNNFFEGSLKNFTIDGKVYGLPRNSDYMVIYYNKAMFEKNAVKVPTTIQELKDAATAFRAKKIIPMSINGKELWTTALLYQNIVQRVSGNQTAILDAIDSKTTFTKETSMLEGAKVLKDLIDAKLFQDSALTADYGASQNLFAQEKAAMWYMGAWEAGMATNATFPESFRNNLAVIKFPVLDGGKGVATDLIAWNGGGYGISTASKHKEEAKKFFDFLMSPDQWAKIAWETGAAVPAQKYEMTGKETEVQKALSEVLNGATSSPGASMIDYGDGQFKNDAQLLFGKIFTAGYTPENLVADLDKAAATYSKR
ncbi:extracellular solute-binding protein [Paenibacillus psychroresistens]|uniref:Extracellular solute-binding protein n=1 Tax=Paenibacillus psychroresistens TaxID=1778678 RepID=A0A6B8RPG5_9BACL|nr:extracellular solute-binding protein [Paenibacillus psychroresistens]QGQ97208.1 extracellular solute-binding protein [Paenibacillus psychroresistens]